jgi:hypothetical protein
MARLLAFALFRHPNRLPVSQWENPSPSTATTLERGKRYEKPATMLDMQRLRLALQWCPYADGTNGCPRRTTDY